MRGVSATVVSLLLLAPRVAQPQATVASAPAGDFLLEITRDWARPSPLGDLQERASGPTDFEVRMWSGYGITRTFGIVLRREAGAWRAWVAHVQSCGITVPLSVGDTASASTRAAFRHEARKNCGAIMGDVGRGGMVFNVDTLALIPLDATSDDIESVWNAAARAGLFFLPPKVPRKSMMMDGTTYVVEVRRGREYRASVIAHVRPPEVEADSQVQRVFEALDAFASRFVKR